MDAERILAPWRWLVGDANLVGLNLFGDLFVKNRANVEFVDVQHPRVEHAASTQEELARMLATAAGQRRWLRKDDVKRLATSGLRPGQGQCYGFKAPLALSAPSNSMYVADVYEYLSFLGDFHRQLKDVPDGGRVIVKVTSKAKASSRSAARRRRRNGYSTR